MQRHHKYIVKNAVQHDPDAHDDRRKRGVAVRADQYLKTGGSDPFLSKAFFWKEGDDQILQVPVLTGASHAGSAEWC